MELNTSGVLDNFHRSSEISTLSICVYVSVCLHLCVYMCVCVCVVSVCVYECL